MPHPVRGYEGRFDAAGWYLCRSVVRLRASLPRYPPNLIDLGMGRGRDLLFLARHGFRVSGIDLSPAALEKAARRAARQGIAIPTEIADLRTVRLPGRYDVVFSTASLNHLPPRLRGARFAHFRKATVPAGIHAVDAIVRESGPWPAPDLEPGMAAFRPGELASYYRDWEVLDSSRLGWECEFGGTAHHHRFEVVIARRPQRA